MNEDIPLPFGLPAVSRLQAMTAFKPGYQLPGKSGMAPLHPTSSFVRVIMGVGFGA
jgi:hypothetical protein